MTEAITRYISNDGQQIELDAASIQKYVATGSAQVSDADMVRFAALCQARKLNPLAGDCYLTVYKNKDGGTTANVQVSKDYYTRIATQKDTYDGAKAGVIVTCDGELVYREGSLVLPEETLVGGWAEVYDKRRSHPQREEVSFAEYNTGRNLWTSKPATMIRKVALVHALRETYPGDFGDLYDSAEMPQPEVVKPEKVETENQYMEQLRDATKQVTKAKVATGAAVKKWIVGEFGCEPNEMSNAQLQEAAGILLASLAAQTWPPVQDEPIEVEAELADVDIEF